MVEIGEKMSAVVDMDRIIFDERGDAYDDRRNLLLHKPLNTGRLVYAKLRKQLQSEIGVEIWWDHFRDWITIEVSKDDLSHRLSFPRERFLAPRVQTLQMIDNMIENIESEVNKWQ